MSTRRRSLLALGAGLVLLAAGVAVGIAAHDDGSAQAAPTDTGQLARYERLIRQAESRPPRFDASIVEIPLTDLPLLTKGQDGNPGYELVETDVTKRIRTNSPSLHPDFGKLPHSRFLDKWARWVREGKLEQKYVRVVALLVRQRSPGTVSTFRMRGEAFDVHGYTPIADPTDVFGIYASDNYRVRRRPIDVEWSPRAETQGAIVPLFLMHFLGIVPGKETHELDSALFDIGVLLTGQVNSPTKLTFEGPGGKTTTVPMQGSLFEPLLLNARTGS
jgi:hypothetical protein